MIITQIKKEKHTYTLFVDDEYFTQISQNTLVKFGFNKGLTLSVSLEEIEREEFLQSCLNKALDLLSRRSYATLELHEKLILKGFPEQSVTDTIEKINTLGYLNDQHFAESFVHDKQHFQKWGKRKIEYELSGKGIHFLPESYNEDLELENARDLIEKKRRSLKESDPNYIQKLKRYLVSKGFEFTTIEEAITSVFQTYKK